MNERSDLFRYFARRPWLWPHAAWIFATNFLAAFWQGLWR